MGKNGLSKEGYICKFYCVLQAWKFIERFVPLTIRFAIRTLRDFGFGKRSMESLIMDEVNETLDWIRKTQGTLVSVNRKFSLAVANVLLTLMTGKRFEHDDPILKNMLDSTSE
jgi:hypothetical protein